MLCMAQCDGHCHSVTQLLGPGRLLLWPGLQEAAAAATRQPGPSAGGGCGQVSDVCSSCKVGRGSEVLQLLILHLSTWQGWAECWGRLWAGRQGGAVCTEGGR